MVRIKKKQSLKKKKKKTSSPSSQHLTKEETQGRETVSDAQRVGHPGVADLQPKQKHPHPALSLTQHMMQTANVILFFCFCFLFLPFKKKFFLMYFFLTSLLEYNCFTVVC